jgi:phosphoribosylaminoimidazole-succinocarboxamide synthase
MNEKAYRDQLPHTLAQTDLKGLGTRRQGKVRDTYVKGDRIFIVTTDRISAFDHVLGTVPFKGEILNRTAAFWFEKTKDVVPNHVVAVPDPNVLVGRACKALPVEFVVRGYLTGSLWRDYQDGKAGTGYGLTLPTGMKKDERFAQAIITPTTKAEVGHDEAISYRQIVDRGLVSKQVLDLAYERTLALFARGQEWARSRGLILVDTKYEFGLAGDELLVIDEIHTMDSSRYWEADEYETRYAQGGEQKMLDKENVRQWLIKERGFKGEGTPPALTDEVRIDTARIYAKAFERITGQSFEAGPGEVAGRIEGALETAGFLG